MIIHDTQESVYTTTEVAEITGFSLRQLDYWARERMIMPSFQQAHGSGSRRLYTVEDLVQLNIVRQLKKHNWSTQKIHKAIETLKDIGQQVMSFVLETLLEEIKSTTSALGIDKPIDADDAPVEVAQMGGREPCY